MKQLEIKNLNKSFNGKQVLKNINLEIKKGEIVVIIGPSGSGKSTLLRCISSLETITSGEIITKDKIGMVFQNFNLFSNLTVLENIMLSPIKVDKKNKNEVKKEAIKLLKSINLIDKVNNYPFQLSGGEKQRVAIIRSLIMKPEILLFDEPTSALDREMTAEVLNLIKSLKKTLIIVTHELEFAKQIADKVIFMDDGEILEMGDILKNPKTERLKQFLNEGGKNEN